MTEREEHAKEWLNRNYGLAMELDAIQHRLDRMQSDIEKATKPIRLREVQEQPTGNSTEDKMADWIDMSADLERRRYVLLNQDKETLGVIENVQSSILRTILIERYVNRKTWRAICQFIPYERSRLFDLHVQALDAVLPFIPEEAK